MCRSLAFLIVLLFAHAAIATPQTINFAQPTYVELDGKYYTFNAGTFTADNTGVYLVQAVVSMTDCARSNGLSMVPSTRSWRWSGGFRIVYLDISNYPDGGNGLELAPVGQTWIVRLRSTTHDITCSGAVAPPPGADTLFNNSFE